MFKREIRGLIYAIMAISAGGLLIHVRIHPPGASVYNWVALVFGLVSTFGVPLLFNYRVTMAWGYVLNVASVVVGTVTMAYFSATHWEGVVTFWGLLSRTTLADILILSAKLPLGYGILQYYRRGKDG